jgi:hypothetical protein
MMMMMMKEGTAFTASSSVALLSRRRRSVVLYAVTASTVEAPTREQTDRKTGKRTGRDSSEKSYDDENDDNNDTNWDYPDLEYLIDSAESREMEDPFHILLLGSTFEKPKVTVPYVINSLEYVLGMPVAEAVELASFAEQQGMSCLGTWPREQCLTLGKQLQVRDIVCRVVPFAAGGQRGWQAKDASDASGAAAGWSSQ